MVQKKRPLTAKKKTHFSLVVILVGRYFHMIYSYRFLEQKLFRPALNQFVPSCWHNPGNPCLQQTSLKPVSLFNLANLDEGLYLVVLNRDTGESFFFHCPSHREAYVHDPAPHEESLV